MWNNENVKGGNTLKQQLPKEKIETTSHSADSNPYIGKADPIERLGDDENFTSRFLNFFRKNKEKK